MTIRNVKYRKINPISIQYRLLFYFTLFIVIISSYGCVYFSKGGLPEVKDLPPPSIVNHKLNVTFSYQYYFPELPNNLIESGKLKGEEKMITLLQKSNCFDSVQVMGSGGDIHIDIFFHTRVDHHFNLFPLVFFGVGSGCHELTAKVTLNNNRDHGYNFEECYTIIAFPPLIILMPFSRFPSSVRTDMLKILLNKMAEDKIICQ
jgi:hypothetical protein